MSSSSGPSQRHVSISSLVYSTLGTGLSLLPKEDKSGEEWTSVEARDDSDEEKEAGSKAEGREVPSGPEESSRPLHTSTISADDVQCEIEEENSRGAVDTASVLSRLYSDSLQQNKRLGFNSKSSAGSVSSSEQATLNKQESLSGDVFSPVVSKQLRIQMSKTASNERAKESR